MAAGDRGSVKHYFTLDSPHLPQRLPIDPLTWEMAIEKVPFDPQKERSASYVGPPAGPLITPPV